MRLPRQLPSEALLDFKPAAAVPGLLWALLQPLRLRLARRLAADLPSSRLELIDDAYTFSMEDNPDQLATLIADFALSRAA